MQLSFINKIVLGINIVVVLCLIGSYGAPYISPLEFWPISFLGLAFPLIFLANMVFVVYWIFSKSKWVLLSVLVGIFGINQVPSFIQFGQKVSTDTSIKRINIVSFNTHYMGAYDMINNDTTIFFDNLNGVQPDIICLQEFANLGGNYEKPLFREFFKRYKNYSNVNADALSVNYPTGYGVCIFTKYPIINKGFVELMNKNSNLTVFADIVVGSDTLRVINTHLKSIVFEKADYQVMQEFKKAGEVAEVDEVKRIGSKIKYAFKVRARQAEIVSGKISMSPYKIILCGDFNDSPTSYVYHTVKGEMKDAFRESGFGMSRTYIGKMPSFRIDYILHDASFSNFNYRTHTINFSDHKMISCTILLK